MAIPKDIYLVRHGETAFNTDPVPRIRGRVDVPLNEAGIRHAEQAGEALRSVHMDAIYYSEVPRAAQTAAAIRARQHAGVRFVQEPLVIDICWGDWEGKTYREAFPDPRDEELFNTDPNRLIIPNGESFYVVLDRIHTLFKRLEGENAQSICLVSHGAVLNLIMCYVCESPLRMFWNFYGSACGITKLRMNERGEIAVKYHNRIDHLA